MKMNIKNDGKNQLAEQYSPDPKKEESFSSNDGILNIRFDKPINWPDNTDGDAEFRNKADDIKRSFDEQLNLFLNEKFGDPLAFGNEKTNPFSPESKKKYSQDKERLVITTKKELRDLWSRYKIRETTLQGKESPHCIVEGKWGYFRYKKNGGKIKIGLSQSRHFKLLQCLTEPFGTAKITASVFDTIKTEKTKTIHG